MARIPPRTRVLASDEVAAFAPATVANLGPGFDVLGLALQEPGDVVVARRSHEPGVRIATITGDKGRLPTGATDNCAGVAAIETLKRAGVDAGVELDLHKGMAIGSGLGSSAASAAASAYAVNLLIGSPMRKADLIMPCVEAEATVAGRHADNVAPSILGGLVMVRSVDPLAVMRLPVPAGLVMVVITPDFELPTREARAALPTHVPIGEMVHNAANVASFVSACYSGDLELLGQCIVDNVVAPARAALVPGAESAITGARRAGALGTSISGAGPSVFALCHSAAAARAAGDAIQQAFTAAGLASSRVVSPMDCPGVRRVPASTRSAAAAPPHGSGATR